MARKGAYTFEAQARGYGAHTECMNAIEPSPGRRGRARTLKLAVLEPGTTAKQSQQRRNIERLLCG